MSLQEDSIEEYPRSAAGLWTTGMALFSMFFGAGNIIFPLVVGSAAKTMTPYAVAGLGLSAVLFPLLGLVSMLFYKGDLRAFFFRLGPLPAAILMFLLYNIQGPLVVLPRLVTLMYASIKIYCPFLPLSLFSTLICLAIFLLTLKPSRIVGLLGKVLTPFLLLTLGVLITVGIAQGTASSPAIESGAHHFKEGLKGGYLTSDLISALLFATIILPHLQRGTKGLSSQTAERVVRKKMFGASLIAAGLLMLTYIGLCLLASRQDTLSTIPPEEMLQTIAIQILGPAGGFIAAAAVFLACLTTAISLSAVFAKYLSQELLKGKLNRVEHSLSCFVGLRQNEGTVLCLGLTLALTSLISNLGFRGLMKIAGPLLQIMYPALIVLCLHNIAYNLYRLKPVKLPVYAALGLGIAGFCLA